MSLVEAGAVPRGLTAAPGRIYHRPGWPPHAIGPLVMGLGASLALIGTDAPAPGGLSGDDARRQAGLPAVRGRAACERVEPAPPRLDHRRDGHGGRCDLHRHHRDPEPDRSGRGIEGHSLEAPILFALMVVTCAIAARPRMSGPLAVVAAGLLIGTRRPRDAFSDPTRRTGRGR